MQHIFRKYADGNQLQQIADRLNAEGCKTGCGNEFSVNGLRVILKNDRYIGVYRCGGYIIEDGMLTLVDRVPFDAAQARFERTSVRGHS